jgi:hypothetical protein
LFTPILEQWVKPFIALDASKGWSWRLPLCIRPWHA